MNTWRITQLNLTAMQDKVPFNETEYMEHFNIGYKMSKDFPEFAEFLDYARGQNDKLDGLKDGRSQYLEDQMEKNKDKSKDFPKNNRPDFLNRNRYADTDMEDKEIDNYDNKEIEKDKD